MAAILKIKINIPPLGANLLPRQNSLKPLDKELVGPQGFLRQLTLISAPAGFGKTTLARQWVAGRENRTAWLSLDQGDSEPQRFWTYLISALQTLDSQVGRGSLEMLRSSALLTQSVSNREALLTPLLNDLFSLDAPIFLVLDDYHGIDNPHIHRDMAYFVDNLPPALHLIVTTRSDPPWPLARWRAKKTTKEIRQADLKFTETESQDLLKILLESELSKSQLRSLYTKSEGWVTGLQLAAFSITSNDNAEETIINFTGSNKHIFHYLIDEVFRSQHKSVQDFLLKTSVLDRLGASLCDAVLSRGDSSKILSDLHINNLFLIPLDQEGRWYRFHSLFRDFLFSQLSTSPNKIIEELNLNAALWYLEQNQPGEAIGYFLRGNALDQSLWVMEQNIEDLWQNQSLGQLIHWLESAPKDLLRKYPRLVAYWVLCTIIKEGKEKAKSSLAFADVLKFDNPEEQAAFEGMLAVAKAYHNLHAHDLAQLQVNAAKALEILPQGNNFWRILAALVLGDVKSIAGDLKAARDIFMTAYDKSKELGEYFVAITAAVKIANNLWVIGKIREAESFSQEVLNFAQETGIDKLTRLSTIWGLSAELLREGGNLEEADRYIQRAISLGKSEKPVLAWSYLFQIILCYSHRDYGRGLEVAKLVDDLNAAGNIPVFLKCWVYSWKARILIKQGEVIEARDALSTIGVTEQAPIILGLEIAQLTLCRVLVLENKFGRARSLLDQVENRVYQRKTLLIDLMLIRSLLEEEEQNLHEAERCLTVALEEGLTGGHFQTFIDEGQPLVPILTRTKDKSGGIRGFAGKILEGILALGSPLNQDVDLVEQLSDRELEVLDLLSQGLSNRAISERLFLSIGTVKWYTSIIYGKLGAKNRAHAVIRAQELNLLS